MKRICVESTEEIVTLAEGRGAPDGRRHAENCTVCENRLLEYTRILEMAKVPWFQAPSNIVAAAKALLAPTRRVVVARVLKSAFVGAGARALPDAAQLVVGSEDAAIRLLATRQGRGYEILGELPGPDWIATSDVARIEAEGSRFSLVAGRSGETGFRAISGQLVIDVPPIEELLRSGATHTS